MNNLVVTNFDGIDRFFARCARFSRTNSVGRMPLVGTIVYFFSDASRYFSSSIITIDRGLYAGF